MTIKEVITAANWRIHPNNQWSFQNIEKLFATEVIKKNHKKQSVFSSNLSKIDAIEFVNLEEKKQTVREMLINGYADSFLVLKKGEIIFEEYFNGMSQESLHLLKRLLRVRPLGGRPLDLLVSNIGLCAQSSARPPRFAKIWPKKALCQNPHMSHHSKSQS